MSEEDPNNTFVQVDSQGWGERLGGSCQSIGAGALAVILGIAALVWNEGNCVAARKSLDEAEKLIVNLDSVATIDSSYEGKLVHVSGAAIPKSSPIDSVFNVAPDDALKLRRTVEMYQWRESKSTKTTKKTGGGTETSTTYSYSEEWHEFVIDSDQFEYTINHENPASMPFAELDQTASVVHMGAFVLSDAVMNAMNWFEPLVNYSYSIDDLPESTVANHSSVSLYLDKGYYFGKNQADPSVGDTRVSWSFVPQQNVSIIARQTGNSFSKYITTNQREVLLVQPGMVSTEEMFIAANKEVTFWTWIVRLGGFVAI